MDMTTGECVTCPNGMSSLPNATSSYACGKIVKLKLKYATFLIAEIGSPKH